MEIANKYANGEEEIRQKNQQHHGGGSSTPNPKPKPGGNNKRKVEDAPTDVELVAAANASGIHGKTQQKESGSLVRRSLRVVMIFWISHVLLIPLEC